MAMPRQKVIVLGLGLTIVVATVGCRDGTAPSVPTQFLLHDISGHQLPTSVSAPPGLTILSASLTLEDGGKAELVEQVQDPGGNATTLTNTVGYFVFNGQIAIKGFIEPCPIDALCPETTYNGTVSDQTLSLLVAAFSIDGSIVYNYRIAPTL
jgi:hypothetical protein